MDLFPLPVFPPGLASSVITTVWVGVWVMALLNLRLGWTFSGLVVPGYLVPLILVKPWSAAVILVEAVLTYLLVWLVSEKLSRLGLWSSFFGRDRFFALVLASVAVRLLLDGWWLPELGAWVNARWGLGFDYRNNLHSFGLIIVALIANQFWKPGLWRGLVPLAVSVGATWGVVRWGLMELTNFNIAGLQYMYEDIATSMLASPKSYIILLTAAFIASRLNLLYGWEFNGILIPSLLALQWYQPAKIATSFVEAWVVLLLADRVLKSRWLRESTVENARKTLLFFSVSYAYKLVLAWLVVLAAPGLKTTDLYGFGYLLPSLLAIKMHDKGIALRMTRATLQTTAAAAVLAVAVGFGLTFLPGPSRAGAVEETEREVPPLTVRRAGLSQVLEEAKVAIYGARQAGYVIPTEREMALFAEGLRELSRRLREGSPDLERARLLLGRAGFRLVRIGDRYLQVVEYPAGRGWGSYLFAPRSRGQLVIEVP
ncbi:MAG TPA: poly-gamma-glutamate biosynthesis protein PgsC/CapC, partial [Thermoanaerobaculia bacterium]|nr:poly-gamma-glutamate biosynthesis protein PgsC/CapC [Thermoanaerobaculia bacterium]